MFAGAQEKQVISLIGGASALFLVFLLITAAFPLGWGQSTNTTITGEVVDGSGDPLNSTVILLKNGDDFNATTGTAFNFTVSNTTNDEWTLVVAPTNGTRAGVRLPLRNKPKRAEIQIETRDSFSALPSPPGAGVTHVDVSTMNVTHGDVTTTIPYDASRLPGPESGLEVWKYADGSWTHVESAHTLSSDTAEVTTPGTPPLALTTHYVDGFDDGDASPDWTGYAASGRWNENNTEGYLVQDSKGTGKLLNRNTTGGHDDYAASVRMKKSKAASNFSSLLLRSDDSGNGVEARVDWDRNVIEIGTLRNGKYRAVESVNYTEATGFSLDTLYWYDARAVLRNGEVRFTVSEPGAPAATVTAPARRLNLAGHRVGLKGRDGPRGDTNLFDNFTVEPLPPEEVSLTGSVNAESEVSLVRPDGIVAKRASGKSFGGLRGRRGWRLDVDASGSRGVAASFGLNGSTGSADVTLRNFSSNPEPRDPAGMQVAFAEVSAEDLNYTDVEISIQYGRADLSNVDESSLTIKHYEDGQWHTVPTTVDPVNDTVTGTVTSLSNFAVTGSYQDTFDDNSMSSDWTKISGTWSETNQRLEHDENSEGLIVNDQADGGFLNYSVTVDVQQEGDGDRWSSILLRSDGSGDNAVETRVDFDSDQIDIGYISGGSRSVVNSTSLSLASDTYYTVNTTVKENNVTVYVDGSKEVEASSTSFDETGGYIGLKHEGDWSDRGIYDDFNVTHYEEQTSSSSGPENVTVNGTIQDGSGSPLTANVSLINSTGTVTNASTGSSFDLQGKTGWSLDVNASSIGVKAKFELSGNSTGTTVTLNDTATNPAPTAPPGTEAVRFAEVSAANLNYSSATIRLDYDESDLGDVPETSLYLRHYDSGWTTVPTTLDADQNYVEGTVSSLSPFAVTGSTNAGDPSLSADRTSSDVAPGYTITYHLTVKNEDDEADTIDLNTSIDNASWSYNISESTVQLDAGKSTAVDLDVTVPGNAAVGSSANVTVVANSSRDATTQTIYQTSYEHFSDADATHDGTQPAGTGSTTLTLFSDGFEDGNLDPWTTTDTDRSGVSTETSNTGSYSMYTRWDYVEVTSNTTDLSSYDSATLSAWISDGADGVNDPEDVESLKVEYRDSAGSWKLLEDISGSGDAGTTYDKQYDLPTDALHRDFQIRFSQQGGSGDPYDYWFIDDVTVETVETSDGDGEVELIDYTDSFDDDSISTDWDVHNGSWSETGGELQQDNDSAGHIYNMNATGTGSIFEGAKDVNVSVDMRTDDTAYWQGLQMRSDPARNGVEVRLDYQNDQVEIADYNTNQRTQVNATSMTLSAGTWYTVNASIHENTVHVWVDGTHRLQATNTSFHSPYRWVNLRGRDDGSASSVNRFENFEVWTLNGTYTSSPLDSQHVDPDYNSSSLYFNTTVPVGTSMNATVTASSDTTFGDSSDSSRTFALADGNHTYATDWMDGYQYVQAEVSLLTDDKSTSPKLHDWGVTRAGGIPSDAVYVETTAAAPEYNVTLNVTPASEDVPPGGSYDFTIDVQNSGTIPDSYTLSKEDSGDTEFFDSSLSTGGIENLDPGESASLTLAMTASPGTPFGSSMTTNVTATSVGDGSVSTTDDATGHVRTKYPDTVRVVTNRYSILDDPNSGNPSSSFDSVPNTWSTDYWTGESTTVRAYAMVQSQYGEPMENETVHFVIEDWAGNRRFDNTTQTNHAGIANATLNTNGINYWGVWTVTATANSTTDTTTFVKNWWGCADCHGDNGDPGTAYTNPSYSRSPYVEGYEESGHNDDETWDCMMDATDNGKCEYCHQDYGGGPLGTLNQDTGGQTPWGTHDGKKKCQDCHTPNSDATWLGSGGGDGNGLPKMPSCFSGSCHNQKNPNVQPWRTTTTDKNQSQYSMTWVAGSEVKGETIYIDKFDDGTLDPWSSTGSGTAGVTTDTSLSGSYSLYVEDADGEATSDTIDLSPYSSGELNFWTDKNSNVDDYSEDLDIYYLAKDTSSWSTDYVWTKLGDVESDTSTPQNVSMDLPSDAFHDQAQIRFNLQDESGENLPRWYMDNVEILTGAQKTGEPSKAHSTYENGGDVPCIMCHGPMHNITTPYPDGQGNDVTEKEQCYQCHAETKHEFYEGISSPQPCTECHTQDVHAIRGSLRMRPRSESAEYDNNRNLLFKVDPQWGTWQRWELAYNDTYNASADVYRDETVQSGTCESCHVGTNQKRGVHKIDLTYVAPDTNDYSYFGWNGSGLDCLGCHDSKLNGSGGQEIHSAHPASYNGSRTECGTCHTGEARKSGVGDVPQSSTTSGTYTVTVFGTNQTYDATQPQTCQQCHPDWHRNPTYDRDRFPTLSQGLNDTLQTNATTNVSALGSFPGPRDPVNSTVSPGVVGKDNCTSAPCHLKSAHEAMNPAAQGNRFPQYQPSGSPGCASCHALNKWDSHPEALTDLYSNYQEDISFRSPCDACHFEAQKDEGYMSNIFKPFD